MLHKIDTRARLIFLIKQEDLFVIIFFKAKYNNYVNLVALRDKKC